MSYENAESLPTLACPLLVNPAEGVERDAKPLHLPPFPEIDLNWEGFTFSHLHWVGIKSPNRERRRFEEWKVRLAIRHEFQHRELSLTPFSQYIKDEILFFYSEIVKIFIDGHEQIPVPLRPDLLRNELEKKWDLIRALHRRSMLVEEVYAIRSSLWYALKEGFIKDKLAQRIVTHYKQGYRKVLPSFPEAYDFYDLMAEKIGETAASAMIHNALGTDMPHMTFINIILEIFKINPRSPNEYIWNLDDHSEEIAKLSFEQAYHSFTMLTDYLDPDDSKYGRKLLSELLEFINTRWSEFVEEHRENDFIKFICSCPDTCLTSEYNIVRDPLINPFFKMKFFKIKNSQEVEHGNPYLLLEAVRQQLTKGKGLLCPFWEDSPNNCCSSENKAFLEKVWSSTSPAPSCELWERMGCLKKKSVAHKTRTAKNIRG